jgi:hypothetical protein
MQAAASSLTCMPGEVVLLQRLPLAELLAAPVAAEPAGTLAGAAVLCGLLAGGRAVAAGHGTVPLEQHARGPRRRAAHTAPHGAAARQAVPGSGPRGARRAGAERADERRHDAAVAPAPAAGVVRGRGAGPHGRQPAAAPEAGDLELAAGVGAEHDLVRDGVEELAAADGPRAAAGRLPRVALAPVDDVPQVGDGARAPRPRGGALGDDRRQVAAAARDDGTGGLVGARHVDLRQLGAAVQRPLEREPQRRWRRLRGLVLLVPRGRNTATSSSTSTSSPEGSSARTPPPLAHRAARLGCVTWSRSVRHLKDARRESEAGGGPEAINPSLGK